MLIDSYIPQEVEKHEQNSNIFFLKLKKKKWTLVWVASKVWKTTYIQEKLMEILYNLINL